MTTAKITNTALRLWYRLCLWRIDAKYGEIDMDMQCTDMTYRQYREEIDALNNGRDYIEYKLSEL